MKSAFPLDAAALLTMFEAMGAPLPPLVRDAYTREHLEDELIGSRTTYTSTRVHKQRRRSTLDDCLVEADPSSPWTTSWGSVAVESPDPALVTETVRRLGLAERRNTCVARGLKALLGWGRSGSRSSTSEPTR